MEAQTDLFATTLHVVALSGGKDSTAMALRLKEMNPATRYTYACTPTGDELPEMFAHWRKLADLLGSPLLPIMHRRGLNGLITDQSALPNWRQRWCTRMLKIEPYAAWLSQQSARYYRVISYVGLRADEEAREGGDYSKVPGVEAVFPMREWGWGLGDVLGYLAERGVTIPKRTDCGRCFFQRLHEWHDLWREHPDVFEEAAAQERAIGHTFRSPGRDTWPASLDGLKAEFEAGRVPKPRRDPIADMQCRVCRI